MSAADPLCGVCSHVESLHVDGRCKGYHDNSYDPYDSDDDPCNCQGFITIADDLRMQMTLQSQVIEFHEAHEHPILESPQVPSIDRVQARARFIAEEFFEVLEAMTEMSSTEGNTALREARELVEVSIRRATGNVDLGALGDGLADMDYINEGTRLEFGINGSRIAGLVHIANMAKLAVCGHCAGSGRVESAPNIRHHCPPCKGRGRVPLKREDGKTIKPEGWRPPDIAGEIKRQQDDPGRFGLLKKVRVR